MSGSRAAAIPPPGRQARRRQYRWISILKRGQGGKLVALQDEYLHRERARDTVDHAERVGVFDQTGNSRCLKPLTDMFAGQAILHDGYFDQSFPPPVPLAPLSHLLPASVQCPQAAVPLTSRCGDLCLQLLRRLGQHFPLEFEALQHRKRLQQPLFEP